MHRQAEHLALNLSLSQQALCGSDLKLHLQPPPPQSSFRILQSGHTSKQLPPTVYLEVGCKQVPPSPNPDPEYIWQADSNIMPRDPSKQAPPQ